MERLLAKLCWLGMPNAGLGAFLAGAYGSLHRGWGLLGRWVAKGIATVLLFACIQQHTDLLGQCDSLPGRCLLTLPRRVLASGLRLWGRRDSTDHNVVLPGLRRFNRTNCLPSTWPRIAGVLILG